MSPRPRNDQPAQSFLHKLETAGEDENVSARDIVEAMGARSFGPLLLVPAIIIVSPVSSIFGLPTLAALLMGLIAVQILLGRDSLWVPARIQRLEISRTRLRKLAKFLRPAARVIDRIVRPRLTALVDAPFDRVIAAAILLITLIMPPLEIVPLANTTTAAAIGLFALALTARDGLLALVAFAATAGGMFWGARALLLD